jgi:CheY-like chemotaxis protein
MKPRILCVDDEPNVLESLRDSLRRRFHVVATTNGFEALRMMVAEPFQVVLSDMRMPRTVDGRPADRGASVRPGAARRAARAAAWRAP